MVRPVDNLIIGADLLGFQQPMFAPGLLGSQPETVPVTAAPAPVVAQPAPTSMALPTPPPPRPRQAATTTPAAQPYDDAIMRNARGLGLLAQTPTSAPVQAQTGLLSDFFGTSFEDPRTRRNLAGAAALLQAGGPQTRPVGTGQAVGMGIEAMLKQQNEMDKLKKVSAKGFEARGPYVRKGTAEYLGEGVFNPNTGQTMLSTPSGEMIPLPADAEPTVKSAFSRELMSASGLTKQDQLVDEHEISLRKLSNYFNSQEGRQFGYKGVADRFVAGIKSLLASDDPRLKLTPEQLSQKLSQSQLQGLLGASRLDVVGGGVMTEQDALRVLDALGGDLTAMQNPEVVAARIKEIYNTRYTRYERDLERLNYQLSAQMRPPREQIPNFFVIPSGTLQSSAGDTSYTIIEGAD